MPCERFAIDDSGKAIITKDDTGREVIEKKQLDILTLPNEKFGLRDEEYLLNMEFFRTLERYTPEDLQKNPIYGVVGWSAKKEMGLAAKITMPEELNKTIKRIKEYFTNYNPKI